MRAFTLVTTAGELWADVTDDMNSTEDWSVSGRVWLDAALAEAAAENANYGADQKVSVLEFDLPDVLGMSE